MVSPVRRSRTRVIAPGGVVGPFAGVVMRWKRVAWAGCLAPVIGGCHTTGPVAHDLVAEKGVARTETGIEREIRRDAREAWGAVRSQFPQKAFTPAFRDGFLDGYVDYLDRGGDAQPPAVPPPRYTRNKKYFTPEGHALIRDYFLGFKYGVDVAVATGQRQYLTVPVLISDTTDHPGPDLPPVVPAVPAGLPARPPAAHLPAPRPLPAENPTGGSGGMPVKTSLPTGLKPAGEPPPARPSLVPPAPGESKFGPVPKPPTPAPGATIPPPVPSIPIPLLPGPGAVSAPAGPGKRPGEVLSKFTVEKRITATNAPPPDLTVKLPEPPASVRSVPDGVPTLPTVEDFPVLPANHTVPPPLPANHPDILRW
ncbi:MAG: hypothetical protein JWO38_7491 [Gemmataceae bacterium]|nr:hypothetical protein [Gemmataceae bacterium]